MKGFFEVNILPAVKELEHFGIKSVKHIDVQDESTTQYPSVWKKLGLNPESGWDATNINKLEKELDPIHLRVPF